MIDRFWDEQSSGFFLRGKDDSPLIIRSKEIYDGATPSGNSVAVLDLLRLGRLTGDQRLDEFGRRALEGFARTLEHSAFRYPQMLSAVDFALGPTKEIVIAGDPAAPETAQMLRTIHERFLPRVVAVLSPEGDSGKVIETLAPYVKLQKPIGGKPTAYVCENFICKLPTNDLTRFAELLDQHSFTVQRP